MIFLTLLVVLIFSISSVSSASVDNADDGKLVKSNAKATTLNATAKVKADTTKVTNVSKTNKTNTKKANGTKTTTVNKKTLAKASTSFMNSVEKKGKFPNVKISNKNYSHTEYLYLISKSVENESNSKIEIKSNLVKPYANTKNKSVKGTINKTEYVKIAGKTRKFIEQNHRAPNWASSSKGNIPYNQLILMFSKCLDTYNKTNKLPNSIKLDDLDLDQIKNKIDSKSATSKKTTSALNKTTTAKKTTSSASNKTTSAKKNTTSTAKKTTSTTAKSNAGNKTSGTSKNSTVKTGETSTNKNVSLMELSMNYVNNILNSIIDKLDPSKFKIDIVKNSEASAKANISKISFDLSGKSNLSMKISPAKNVISTVKKTASIKKNTTSTAKKTTGTKKNTTSSAKKTATSTTKKTANKTASKTNAISKALKEYLKSSKNCQVTNKQIQALAKSLTSSLKSEYTKGKKIFAWVRDNIRYEKYSNTRKGALKTLKKRYGNCVDQSHLLIALSRAAGIPTRYVNGGNCKFSTGYVSGHVWAEMYINKKWMVADPTSYRNTLGKIRNWNTKSYTLYGKYSSINF